MGESDRTDTLTSRLKSATAELHQRVEHHPFIQSARNGELRLENYRGYLRALAIVHSTLENILERSSDEAVHAVWNRKMARLKSLESDISHLSDDHFREPQAPIKSALAIADDIRLRAGEQAVSLLGYLYVLEGSTRGAPVLRLYIEQSLGLRAETACSYFTTEGAQWDRRWLDFKQRLDNTVQAQDARESVVAGAIAAFVGFEDLFTACHTDSTHESARHVTILNPEGGRHPIPDEPVELEAACRAGERCWERYPYLALRYGDRGKRFTASDGAWVATLVGEDQTEVDRQLNWLAALLAARGLPRLLMEDHLSLLHEELSAANPHGKLRYRKLKTASERLARERFGQINPARWQALRVWYASRTGELSTVGAFNSHLPEMTDLILSAVADQQAGLPTGTASLVPWLLRDGRLPPEWVTATEELIARAKRVKS